MAERDLQAEMENMKSELSKLRADMAGVASALKGVGAAEAETARERAGEYYAKIKEEVRHAAEELRDRSKKSVEAVEHEVGEHPFISLIAAFGVGFLVGKLLERK